MFAFGMGWGRGAAETASNRILNGNFDTTASWGLDPGWSIANGVLTGATVTGVAENIASLNAVTYEVTIVMTRTAGSVQLQLGTTLGTSRATSGTFVERIVCDSGTLIINGTGFTGTIDDIYVEEI